MNIIHCNKIQRIVKSFSNKFLSLIICIIYCHLEFVSQFRSLCFLIDIFTCHLIIGKCRGIIIPRIFYSAQLNSISFYRSFFLLANNLHLPSFAFFLDSKSDFVIVSCVGNLHIATIIIHCNKIRRSFAQILINQIITLKPFFCFWNVYFKIICQFRWLCLLIDIFFRFCIICKSNLRTPSAISITSQLNSIGFHRSFCTWCTFCLIATPFPIIVIQNESIVACQAQNRICFLIVRFIVIVKNQIIRAFCIDGIYKIICSSYCFFFCQLIARPLFICA